VGREPDTASASAALQGRPVQAVAIGSPTVSSNHLLMWEENGQVCLRDLDSRNGTWLRLPGDQVIRLSPDAPISVHLAAAPSEAGEARALDQPRDARWEAASDFGPAVASAVRDWLGRVMGDVQVTLAESGESAPEGASWLPLRTGQALVLQPRQTADARWARLLERLFTYADRQGRAYEAEEASHREGLIMVSAAMREAHRQVVEAAERGLRVVLLGPSGSGKEGLARGYHRQSGSSGAFVAVNCALLSGDRLRAELFGAERGSFTSAVSRIVGAVERAHGGTLFLDEVAQMSPAVQPMLLRFLDSGEYERMGKYGRHEHADVRIVCATNENLRAAALEGRFRADLWYRLAGQVVQLAPLRERFEDLMAFLRAKQAPGAPAFLEMLSPEALEVLRAHQWDGNFRELANFAERLPRATPPGGISAEECRRLLDAGSLVPVPERVVSPPASEGLDQVFRAATVAFADDHGGRAIASWDDCRELLEQYVKPLLFARLSGADQSGLPLDSRELATLANQLAARVDADRGTAQKQLLRYASRFSPPRD